MSRSHQRQHQRLDPSRIRGVAVINLDQAHEYLSECGCPWVARFGRMLSIVHDHRHACPALRRWPSA